MSDGSTWANDIVIDQSILDIATGTRAAAGARKLTKFEVVQALSDAFDIGAKRGEARQDPISDVFTKLTPIPEPKITNERYNILAKIVEQLPEDMWYGVVTSVNGKETVQVPALTSLNILPYLDKLKNDPNAPDVDRDALKTTIEKVQLRVDQTVEFNAASRGQTPADESVKLEKERARTSTTMPSVDQSGTTAPGQFDAAAAIGDMTAQEYAQTFVDTTLADLGFDEALRFNLSGLVNGSPVGPDGGYDVYKAPQFIYGLSADQLTKLQSSLQAAGYFDLVGDTPRFGDNRDRATRLAWDQFLVDVVAAGEQASPQDVLNNRIAMQDNKTMPTGATYADQATLRQMANEFGRAIVGRNLTIAEQQDFLNKAREWEKEAVLRFGVAQDSPSLASDTERVDIQSRAELYFQDQFNVEAGRVALSEWAAQFK